MHYPFPDVSSHKSAVDRQEQPRVARQEQLLLGALRRFHLISPVLVY